MSVVVNPSAGGRVMVKPVSGGRIVYPSARAPAVAKPTLTIVGGTTETSTTPTLQTSAFSSIGGVPVTQTATSWQVAEDAGFTTIAWQSNDDPDDLTEIVTGELGGGASLYARAQHHGETAGSDPVSSPWSDAVAFTVAIDFEIMDLEPVVWLDLREAGTMWQESYDNPVVTQTANGQPVGLLFDIAHGSGATPLGAEMVLTGDMSSAAGWTVPTGWAITDGQAVHTAGTANGYLLYPLSLTAGALYRVQGDLTKSEGTAIFNGFGTDRGYDNVLATSANGSFAVSAFARSELDWGSVFGLRVFAYANTAATVDNVSVKPVLGHPAWAAVDDERPTFESSVPRVVHDGVADQLTVTVGDLGTDATVATLVTGTWSYLEGQTIGAGDYDLPTTDWTAVIILDRAMTSEEKTWLEAIT